jgi:hypothetical protein
MEIHGLKRLVIRSTIEIFLKDPDLRSRNGLWGEAYLDLDFSSLTYLSDVGIRWNKASSTQELIFKIVSHEWPVIYMLTHPDYWSCSPLRAFGLRLAAKGIRYFRVNQIIASVRHVVALLKR